MNSRSATYLLGWALILVGAAFGQRTTPDYERASRAFQAGRFFEAEPYFARVAAANPKSAKGFFGLALCQARTQRLTSAVRNFERASLARDANGQVFLHYGIALEAASKPKEALVAFDRSIELSPNNPETWFHRGLLRVRTGQRRSARRNFERCLKIKARFAGAKEELAALDSKEGRHESAEKVLLSLLKIEPHRVRSLHLLARNYARSGQRAKARTWSKKWRAAETAARKRQLREKRLLSQLALAYEALRSGELELAFGYFEASWETSPGHQGVRRGFSALLRALSSSKHAALRARIEKILSAKPRPRPQPKSGSKP